MLLTATMAAWAEDTEQFIESTFTGWTCFPSEMYSEGVLQTMQDNDWDFQGITVIYTEGTQEEIVVGIETVEAAVAPRFNKLYNLNGQHVVSPSKGLYIVNGKKVLVK